MKRVQASPVIIHFAVVIALWALGNLPVAWAADDRGRGYERRPQHEQREGRGVARRIERVERDHGRYRSPSWELDRRFRHNHYYPRHGSFVTALPPDFLEIGFRGNRFYFQGGVWFRHVGLNFEVTLPPPGIHTPVLPPAYTTVWTGSQPYYYANDVYYTQAEAPPGYVVVEPPAEIDTATVQPAPVVTPAPIVTPSPAVTLAQDTAAEVDAEPLFVYPRNKQAKSRMMKDRNECNRWATEQTGYDPITAPDARQRSNYRRAVSACMEGRGYTVR